MYRAKSISRSAMIIGIDPRTEKFYHWACNFAETSAIRYAGFHTRVPLFPIRRDD